MPKLLQRFAAFTALVLLGLAGLKALDVSSAVALVHGMSLSRSADITLALGLAVEPLLALGLLYGCFRPGAIFRVAQAGTILFLAATSCILLMLKLQGLNVDCGCAGPIRTSLTFGLIRNALLIAVTVFAEPGLWAATGRPCRVALWFTGAAALALFLGALGWSHAHQATDMVRGLGSTIVVQGSDECPPCRRLRVAVSQDQILRAHTVFLVTRPPDSNALVQERKVSRDAWILGPGTPTILILREGHVTRRSLGLNPADSPAEISRSLLAAWEKQQR